MPRLLPTAIHGQKWDLAAHALVLATIQTRIRHIEEKRNAPKRKHPARQS
ncbi:MAG: hypothetical protein NTU41_14765 [Chloroflexi bacterium]|nr:hypothetical protein [Chloroflexota bacterium]